MQFKNPIRFFLVLLLPLISVRVLAADPLFLGLGSEIVFPASDAPVLFAPCNGDAESSCAILKKDTSGKIGMKSAIECMLRVKAKIGKMDTSKGRTFTAKQLGRDESGKPTSVILEGAKVPVTMSCNSRYSQMTMSGTESVTEVENIELMIDLLTGFKEFHLGNVVFDKQMPAAKPNSTTDEKKSTTENPGGTI